MSAYYVDWRAEPRAEMFSRVLVALLASIERHPDAEAEAARQRLSAEVRARR